MSLPYPPYVIFASHFVFNKSLKVNFDNVLPFHKIRYVLTLAPGPAGLNITYIKILKFNTFTYDFTFSHTWSVSRTHVNTPRHTQESQSTVP